MRSSAIESFQAVPGVPTGHVFHQKQLLGPDRPDNQGRGHRARLTEFSLPQPVGGLAPVSEVQYVQLSPAQSGMAEAIPPQRVNTGSLTLYLVP